VYFRFHTELEDDTSGLKAKYRRYDKHHIRVKSPPHFDKPFYALFSDSKTGFLLAPAGTPNTVEYVIANDLAKLLPFDFQQEIQLNRVTMKKLLTNVRQKSSDSVRINSITAQILEEEKFERRTISLDNIGTYNELQELEKQYKSFELGQIDCEIHYQEDSVKHSAKLILRSHSNKPLSDTLSDKNTSSKKGFFGWLGELLASTFPESS